MNNSNFDGNFTEQLLNSILIDSVKKHFGTEGINSVDDFIDRIARKVIEIQNESSVKTKKRFTKSEICEMYRISPATLERWIRAGLKYENTGSRTTRYFTIENIENFKKNRR